MQPTSWVHEIEHTARTARSQTLRKRIAIAQMNIAYRENMRRLRG
jgi:hypothetical protein